MLLLLLQAKKEKMAMKMMFDGEGSDGEDSMLNGDDKEVKPLEERLEKKKRAPKSKG